MSMSPDYFPSGLELAGLVAAGAVTSTELVEDAVTRADRYDEAFGLFITRLDEQAREWAADADRQRAAGDERPLLGIPFAVKDLHPLTGVPCSMGSAAIPSFPAPADSGTIARFRAAGLIPIGTTNTSEFGATCFTHTTAAGSARNPWDSSRSAAGSSGGSAAAVAAGVVPWAHGSDGAGSIRLPASVCGLVGHKPSRGVTPEPGPSFISLAVEGALTRTVADAFALFEVLADPAPGGMNAMPSAPTRTGPLRVAVCLEAGPGRELADYAVRAATAAGDALKAQGHRVVEIADPFTVFLSLAPSCMLDVFSASVAAGVAAAVSEDKLELLQPFTRFLLKRGQDMSAAGLAVSLARLGAATAMALDAHKDYDVVISPTTTRAQFGVEEFWLDFGDASAAAMTDWGMSASVANCTGEPAMSLPLGVDDDGLPQGVQLLGHRGEDRTLFSLAAELETALPWAGRRPALHLEPASASPKSRSMAPVGA